MSHLGRCCCPASWLLWFALHEDPVAIDRASLSLQDHPGSVTSALFNNLGQWGSTVESASLRRESRDVRNGWFEGQRQEDGEGGDKAGMLSTLCARANDESVRDVQVRAYGLSVRSTDFIQGQYKSSYLSTIRSTLRSGALHLYACKFLYQT